MSDANGEEFGPMLHGHRRRQGLSQAELAERSGVAMRAIGALENGERRAPHRDTVERLAIALELSVAERSIFETAAAGARRRAPRRPRPDAGDRAIGRDAAIAAVRSLLDRHPLVTLSGFGGIGKSRIARDVAAAPAEADARDVRVVACASASDARTFALAVGAAVRIAFDASDPLAALAVALRRRRLLLVLDDCEAIVDVVRPFATMLIESCPNVKLLVTSRHRLMLSHECVYRVDPLPADAAADIALRAATEDATDSDALAVARAVAEAAEGIPLSIELAARLARPLPAGDARDRVAHALLARRDGDPHAEARHRTLQANLDRSYDLLDDAERALLRRLSVFAGAFDGAAVDAVCADERIVPFALPVLATLVDKSLVNVSDPNDSQVRYTLFAVTRAYAARKLAEAGEETTLSARYD